MCREAALFHWRGGAYDVQWVMWQGDSVHMSQPFFTFFLYANCTDRPHPQMLTHRWVYLSAGQLVAGTVHVTVWEIQINQEAVSRRVNVWMVFLCTATSREDVSHAVALPMHHVLLPPQSPQAKGPDQKTLCSTQNTRQREHFTWEWARRLAWYSHASSYANSLAISVGSSGGCHGWCVEVSLQVPAWSWGAR